VADDAVSVDCIATQDLHHTLCLLCTPMYTFYYNAYVSPFTLRYLISASLQDVTYIVVHVCMHAPEGNIKRLTACTGTDSLSYVFGVTVVWACELYAFWNFNSLIF